MKASVVVLFNAVAVATLQVTAYDSIGSSSTMYRDAGPGPEYTGEYTEYTKYMSKEYPMWRASWEEWAKPIKEYQVEDYHYQDYLKYQEEYKYKDLKEELKEWKELREQAKEQGLTRLSRAISRATRGANKAKAKAKANKANSVAATDDNGLKHPKSVWTAAGLFGLTIFLTAATALIIRNLQKRACDKKKSFSNKP